jgi:DNA-3-methyladenine glycosylase II
METFTLVPRGPFSLAASIGFLEGFTPASYSGAGDSVLELAFPVEGSWRTAGVRVRQDAGGAVTAEIVSPAEPGPDLVAEVRPQVERILSLPGLAGRKPEWLRSVARAALDGQLDAARLRAMPPERALADLKKLPGIGDFSAGLTLLRGAGAPDAGPGSEPRLARAVALAYGLPGPATPEQIAAISDKWRPYRTWVTLLLRVQLEYSTGEITGRPGHARTG